jgi:hypothetical protein
MWSLSNLLESRQVPSVRTHVSLFLPVLEAPLKLNLRKANSHIAVICFHDIKYLDVKIFLSLEEIRKA